MQFVTFHLLQGFTLSIFTHTCTNTNTHTLSGPLNLTVFVSLALLAASDSLSPARPGLAELSMIGPWLAPLCPAINPDPLALGTVGQGSRPNPPLLLLSTLQLGQAKLSPPLQPPSTATTAYFIHPITHHSLQIKYTDCILLLLCLSMISILLFYPCLSAIMPNVRDTWRHLTDCLFDGTIIQS